MFRPKIDVKPPVFLSWPRACAACGTMVASQIESGQTFHYLLHASETSEHPILLGTKQRTVTSRADAVIYVCKKCLQAYEEDKARYMDLKSVNRRKVHLLTIVSVAISVLAMPAATYLGGWAIPVPSTLTLVVLLPAVLVGWMGNYLASLLRMRAGPRTKPPKTPYHNYIRLRADGTLLLANRLYSLIFERDNPRVKTALVSFPKEVENQSSRASACCLSLLFSLTLAVLSMAISYFVMIQ
jgi:hypothetical protein